MISIVPVPLLAVAKQLVAHCYSMGDAASLDSGPYL